MKLEPVGIFPLIPVLVVGGLVGATVIGGYGMHRLTSTDNVTTVVNAATQQSQKLITNITVGAVLFGIAWLVLNQEKGTK